jgi:hypothetical protein
MKISSFCTQCLHESIHKIEYLGFRIYSVPYYDDMIVHFECSRGHKNLSVIDGQKFEVLLQSGADALHSGFTLEAAATFSAALERFFEFCTKVMLVHKEMDMDLFDEMFKEMARQSERQLGAFMALHALVLGIPFVPNKDIAPFRNSVIHKGKIPTPEDAQTFCGNVYSEIFRTADLLRQNCQEAINTVIAEDLRIRKAKLPDSSDTTKLMNGIYSISDSIISMELVSGKHSITVHNYEDFSQAFKEYRYRQEFLEKKYLEFNERFDLVDEILNLKAQALHAGLPEKASVCESLLARLAKILVNDRRSPGTIP